MIPFSPPRMDNDTVEAVKEVLLSGWITTGPKTKLFEKELTAYNGNKNTLCLNSATAGLEIILRWFGVKEGDEVILPAYTYCATANVVKHVGAIPVLVDVNDSDFNMDPSKLEAAITKNTKVIMPVDVGGIPCDFDWIHSVIEKKRNLFSANTEEQKSLGRILILSDAAHSVGATYNGKRTGSLTDISVFSFHAVKNLTTAEGGAVALNLPSPFDNEAIYKYLCVKTLHGQNKDALAKTKLGGWKYDVIEPGYKCNMMDLQAAIGLVELKRYESTLIRRKEIASAYDNYFSNFNWARVPLQSDDKRQSCYHLYMLRLNNCSEEQRDAVINEIMLSGVSVNVHFIPLPMLTFYKNEGYKIENYPVTYKNYSCEISLPIYFDLTNEQINQVCESVFNAVKKVLSV
jgi:dTDP-4-amino-4,6-dideoxygalactose transaminase